MRQQTTRSNDNSVTVPKSLLKKKKASSAFPFCVDGERSLTDETYSPLPSGRAFAKTASDQYATLAYAISLPAKSVPQPDGNFPGQVFGSAERSSVPRRRINP